MRWLRQRLKSRQALRSTNSLEEKINYYCLNLEKDMKGLETQQIKDSMDMKNHLFEELRELVERY